MSDKIKNTADSIRILANNFEPEVAVILGSGLSRFAESVIVSARVPYSDIPGFPVSTVKGHNGELIFGEIMGRRVVVMSGRFHYYEGYSSQQITFPVRVFKQLGVNTLLVSNAAGAVNQSFLPGDIMIITDHINFIPNPLIGTDYSDRGERFPDMGEPYSKRLSDIARKKAEDMGVNIKEGCYVSLTGPSYETRAEIKYLRLIGADAVGMSTVPEVIVARHESMEVFAMSVITNMATTDQMTEKLSHEDVVKIGLAANASLSAIFAEVIKNA